MTSMSRSYYEIKITILAQMGTFTDHQLFPNTRFRYFPMKYNRHIYYLHPEYDGQPWSWIDGDAYCNKINGYLLVVNNQKELIYLKSNSDEQGFGYEVVSVTFLRAKMIYIGLKNDVSFTLEKA